MSINSNVKTLTFPTLSAETASDLILKVMLQKGQKIRCVVI
ncbi:predicted protein [Botrytis cinerea T4]|uniref:Uncharacterized protein n=1 Tax=Botryotinia fuckeliana (strain T4) TaxID=999810 RepID=G2Y2V2_BOTF4|nr:predicted protein [Botrytis cinerea T4]